MFIRFADTVLRHARAFLLTIACVMGLVVAALHATALDAEKKAVDSANRDKTHLQEGQQ